MPMPLFRTSAVPRAAAKHTLADAEELATQTAKGTAHTPSKSLLHHPRPQQVFATGEKVRMREFQNDTELNGQVRLLSLLLPGAVRGSVQICCTIIVQLFDAV